MRECPPNQKGVGGFFWLDRIQGNGRAENFFLYKNLKFHRVALIV